jgi:hypothetical protein
MKYFLLSIMIFAIMGCIASNQNKTQTPQSTQISKITDAPHSNTDSDSSEYDMQYLVVNDNSVNVRLQPSLDSEIVEKLDMGYIVNAYVPKIKPEIIILNNLTGYWMKVDVIGSNNSGYIFSSLLSEEVEYGSFSFPSEFPGYNKIEVYTDIEENDALEEKYLQSGLAVRDNATLKI